MITDFRLNKNSNVQVKADGKWRNLITFTDDCPHGKYGYKMNGVNKAFNPYIFFNSEDIVKIETYLRR